MTFHPGGLFGLPPGVPAPLYDLGWWRYLLTGLALAAAWMELRGRPRGAVAAAVALAVSSLGFWVLALGRPYGVFVDPEITRWAADVSVAAQAGGVDGALVGEPGARGAWAALARAGMPADLLLMLPTWMPLIVLLATTAAAALLAERDDRALTAVLWLGASTGALDTLRGAGLLTTLWARPEAGGTVLAALALVVGAHRVLPVRVAVPATVIALLAAALAVRGGPPLAPMEVLWLATLDQWPWILPAMWALRRSTAAAPRSLLLGGAAALLVGLGRGSDAIWVGHAAYRLGVLLLAAHALRILIGGVVEERLLASRVSRRALSAALVLVTLSGSVLVWWEPTRMDPVARASLEPVAPGLLETMEWVRGSTPPSAVFLAGEDYAPSLAVLGGRRVLRAAALATASDDERRRRLERAVLSGRDVPDLVDRYGLRYVLAAPGQFREQGRETDDLSGVEGLRLVHASPRGLRVYEVGGRGSARIE